MYEGVLSQEVATFTTIVSAWTLCFVLFIGLKLRWFRARMKFNTSTQSADYSSAAGIYRSTRGDQGLVDNTNNSQSTIPASDMSGKLNSYKSMPNLSAISEWDSNTDSSGQNSSSINAKRQAPLARNQNSSSTQIQELKLQPESAYQIETTAEMSSRGRPLTKESEKMNSKTRQNVNSNNFSGILAEHLQAGLDRRKNPIADAATGREDYLRAAKQATPLSTLSDSTSDGSESENLTIISANSASASSKEQKVFGTLPNRNKTKSKAPPPPPPPPPSGSNFHAYEEFET